MPYFFSDVFYELLGFSNCVIFFGITIKIDAATKNSYDMYG